MKVLLVVIVSAAVSPVWNNDVAFNVSLELQGGHCTNQLALICRHSDVLTPPLWTNNETLESGEVLGTAFPGGMYSVLSHTEHRVTIRGVGNVQALDGYIIQCAYVILGNLIKSNAVKYSFIPPDYRPALSLVSVTADFSERFCNFTYSYQESCSLYPRCIPYFSVKHTVSPQSAVSNSSSGCGVEYTIHNLMRCVSYQSTATTLLPSQRGIPVVVGDTVMQSPGQFTITSVSIGVDRNLVNVTYMENESDCPEYPTEQFTVVVDDEAQVANMTADEFQSLAINHTDGSVTLSLPLSQPLPENAVKLNMTKYNTVPTNKSDVTGKMVTEMVPWGTSALFDLSQESSAAMNDEGEASVGVVVGAIISGTTIVVVITIAVVVLVVIARKRKARVCGTLDLKATDDVLDGMGGTPPSPARTDVATLSGCVTSSGEFDTEDPHNLITEETKTVGTPELESGAGDHKGCDDVAQTKDAATSDEGGDVCKRIGRRSKVDWTRGNTAGSVVPQETICAFGDDASTGHDYV